MGLNVDKALAPGRLPGVLFCRYRVQLSARKKILHPKSTLVCRNNFEQFLETKSLLCESLLRSPQGVTWLGSNAADQGALGSMSHLMRCQMRCDALANDARSSIASTGQTREGQKQGEKINVKKKIISYAEFKETTGRLPSVIWF